MRIWLLLALVGCSETVVFVHDDAGAMPLIQSQDAGGVALGMEIPDAAITPDTSSDVFTPDVQVTNSPPDGFYGCHDYVHEGTVYVDLMNNTIAENCEVGPDVDFLVNIESYQIKFDPPSEAAYFKCSGKIGDRDECTYSHSGYGGYVGFYSLRYPDLKGVIWTK